MFVMFVACHNKQYVCDLGIRCSWCVLVLAVFCGVGLGLGFYKAFAGWCLAVGGFLGGLGLGGFGGLGFVSSDAFSAGYGATII